MAGASGTRVTRMSPVVLLAPLLLVLQAWPGATGRLRFLRDRYQAGAWWELLSAQFVHLSLPHALVNAGAIVVLARLLGPAAGWQFGALAGGAVGVALILALDPACLYYAGASGALHGLLAGACARQVRGLAGVPGSSQQATWGAWGLLGLLLKVASEAAGWWPSAWSFPVYWPAHAAGLAGGLLAVLVSGLAHRRAAPWPPQQRE